MPDAPVRAVPDQSRVCLTFDDGPDPQFTPRVLDVLEQHEVQASFFVLGNACVRSPDLVRRMLAEGHLVGSHGWSHRHPWFVSAAKARDEVRRGFDAIAIATGTEPRWFRPPFGRLRRAMLDEARSLGMRSALWTRSAIDWGSFGRRPESIARRLLLAQGGDILLCHDAPMIKNHPRNTLAILPAFIEHCVAAGLTLSTLDDGLRQPQPAANA